MFTIKIQGGLGNQLFQYAYARSQSLKHNVKFYLDTTLYLENFIRSYTLDKFNIIENINNNPIEDIIIRESQFNFSKELQYINDGHIIGYFQNEKYFKEYEHIIRKDLTLKNPIQQNEFIDKIYNTNSIAVQVRRGDYFSNKDVTMHAVDLSMYYMRALSLLGSFVDNPTVFFFSDDIEYVKNNVSCKYKSVYVTGLKDYEELYLISQCKNHVIGNSSFGWWGTWLSNNNGKKIAPKEWFNDKEMQKQSKDVIPKNWIRI